MNNKFDELTKGLAQSVTRRGALKKFGLGLAGIALAAIGIPSKANADPGCTPLGHRCRTDSDCCSNWCFFDYYGKKSKLGYCASL